MTDPLAVYLHDHLAGFRGAPLGNFAAAILPEIEQDREVLKGIVDRLGEGHADLKEAAAWFAEKASRFKLARDKGDALGIQGKASLWSALFVISQQDNRVRGADLSATRQAR
jgi:hypothetical protein